MNIKKLTMTKRQRLAVLLNIGAGAALFCAAMFSSMQAHAEYLGLPTGRSADISSMPDFSVEAGFVTGDIQDADYQNIGARFNFRASSDIMIFGDIGQIEIGDEDDLGFGAGFFYQIAGITKSNNFAIKVSYHTIEIDESATQFEIDGDILAVEGVFSGEKIGESNLGWYTNVGIHKFDFGEGFDDTEFGFGAGVITDTSFGEFFGGVDLIDEITFGFGVRYHIQ